MNTALAQMILPNQTGGASGAIWWVITGTAVFSAFMGLLWSVWLIRVFRRDLVRHRDGLCLKCGYDTNHNTGLCPECGEPIRDLKKR